MGERILVVDDEVDIAQVLHINLEAEGFEVAIANDPHQALEEAQRFRPDLVLLDINMPGMDGLQVTRLLRSDALTASTSIILLTAKASVDDRLVGLASGADDYITKPFDIEEVLSRVRAALRRSHQLRGVSPLTALPGNFEILRQLHNLLGEEGPAFALIHVDLDNFKAYNDHYGFIRGDEAIRATGELLMAELGRVAERPRFLGHVGGDDFAVIVPAASAEEVAEHIIVAFDKLVPSLYDAEDVERQAVEIIGRDGVLRQWPLLTVSLGIATTALRGYASPVEMAAVASEMKAFAKRHTGSAWRIDRRRGDRPIVVT
jgi:diguanylate cyclase (GGDEF)-like protein